MKRTTFISFILSSISVLLFIIGSFLIRKSSDISSTFLLNNIITIIALIVFVIVTLVSKNNKLWILIPLLVLMVSSNYFVEALSSQVESILIDTEDAEVVINYSISLLQIFINVLLVVSYIFALKDKKWASIIVIIVLSLLLVVLYKQLLNINEYRMNLLNDSSYHGYLAKSLGGIEILIGATALVNVSQITYFVGNLLSEKKKDNQENDTLVKEKIEQENN